MSNYSKLFGALVGSCLGLAAAFGIDTEWMTPEIQGAIIGALSIVGTFIAPSNKPT